MKNLIILILSLCFVSSFGQTLEPDTIQSKDQVEQQSSFTIATGVGLHSRYFWRGVKFGTGPSIQGYFDLSHKSGLGIGAFGAANLSGSFSDYGNTMNLYLYYHLDLCEDAGFTFFVDDYYFYNEDNLDLTFDYGDKTLHYIELRLESYWRLLDLTIAYSVYQGRVPIIVPVPGAPNTTITEFVDQDAAPYIELGVAISESTRIFAGGVTGASALNFQTDAGITNLGVTHSREIRKIPFETTLAVNLFYENIYQEDPNNTLVRRGATRSAISLIVGVVF